jgi:hypothetical protein
MTEIKVPSQDIERIFKNADLGGDGEINYSEFLAVTVDRKKALQHANLMFAFHHFDTDGSGYITGENLRECFQREGRHLSNDEVDMMVAEVNPQIPGKVSLEEFENYMRLCLAAEPGSALAASPFLVATGIATGLTTGVAGTTLRKRGSDSSKALDSYVPKV